MKLNEYIKRLQELKKEHGNVEVIYSMDDEGNGESTPSPISFYLLSVADKLSDNPKGSQYNYQRYTEVKKEHNGQLFDLIESL